MSNESTAVLVGAIAGSVLTASAGAIALGHVAHVAGIVVLSVIGTLAAAVLFIGLVST